MTILSNKNSSTKKLTTISFANNNNNNNNNNHNTINNNNNNNNNNGSDTLILANESSQLNIVLEPVSSTSNNSNNDPNLNSSHQSIDAESIISAFDAQTPGTSSSTVSNGSTASNADCSSNSQRSENSLSKNDQKLSLKHLLASKSKAKRKLNRINMQNIIINNNSNSKNLNLHSNLNAKTKLTKKFSSNDHRHDDFLSFEDENESEKQFVNANFLSFKKPKSKSFTSSSSFSSPSPWSNKYENSEDFNNSEDEYEESNRTQNENNTNINNISVLNIEEEFERRLKEKKGFLIKKMKQDGACLFRAVADQIYGDEEMHSIVRSNCIDYIEKNADYFREYITEDFGHYLARKRHAACYGNHIEIMALTEMYNRPIEVYEYDVQPKNTFQSVFQSDYEPIRLSYHDRNHYNSIVHPYKATIGLGLGLPGFVPGLAEKSLLSEALQKSEQFHLEKAMLDDKLKATDWEATNDEMMQMAARESYLQWLNEQQQQQQQQRIDHEDAKKPFEKKHEAKIANANAQCCSSWDNLSYNKRNANTNNNTMQQQQSENNTTNKANEFCASTSASRMDFLFENESASLCNHVLDEANDEQGGNNDDNDILAKVLAISHQEYLESLKLKHHQQQQEHQNNY